MGYAVLNSKYSYEVLLRDWKMMNGCCNDSHLARPKMEDFLYRICQIHQNPLYLTVK